MKTLKKLFSIDLRAVAVFRISLASILIYDLLLRSLDLAAHYTSSGVAPASYIRHHHLLSGQWSLHLWLDTGLYEEFLFVLAAISYLCLFLGYRTRLFTFASWVMVVSLNNRNPIIDNSADYLIGALLLWLFFLPSGAKLSIDSKKNTPSIQNESVLSAASAIILLQILVVYFEAGNAKNIVTWLVNSSAVSSALSLELYITPLGALLNRLLSTPQEEFLSHSIFYGELLIPFIVMFPFGTGAIRTLIVLIMGVAHLGLGLSMDLGAFGPLMTSCWVLFLPPKVWDKFSTWSKLIKSTPKAGAYSGQNATAIVRCHSTLHAPMSIFLLVLFVYPTFLHLPQPQDSLMKPHENYENERESIVWLPARVLALDHHWGVFPSPGDGAGRISIIGHFPGTSENLDVLGNPLPPDATQLDTFRRFRWKKFFNNFLMRLKLRDQSLDKFGELLCRNLSAKSPISIEIQFSQVSQVPYWKGQIMGQSKIIPCNR